VQEQFERWRAGRQPREPIPAALWDAAGDLCKVYSLHRVSRWLRLNQTRLKDRAGKSCRRRRPGPAFVECSLAAGTLPAGSSAEYVVEVAAGEGGAQRIHVRGASVPEVAALARALRASAGGA